MVTLLVVFCKDTWNIVELTSMTEPMVKCHIWHDSARKAVRGDLAGSERGSALCVLRNTYQVTTEETRT